MARMVKKSGSRKRFAEGGNTDRYQAKYDRKIADIESDYKKAQARKTGRAAEVAKAKYEQRMADAKDDLAKWRGGDRTETRAAERAAERNLSATRRAGARAPLSIESAPSLDKYIKPASTADMDAISKKATPPKPSAPRAPVRRAPVRSAPPTTKPSTNAAVRKSWGNTGVGTKTGMFYLSDKVNPKHADFYRAGMTPAEAKNQLKLRQRTQGEKSSDVSKDNSAAGRRARMGAVFSSLFANNPYFGTAANAGKGESSRPLLLTGEEARKANEEARKANKGTIGGKKKGGKITAKATKAGKAMVKKSADTMGRAMKFAKGGSVDGCAIRGKTRAPMKKGK